MPFEAVTLAQLCVGGAIEPSSFTFLILLGKGHSTVKTCILIQKLVRNAPFISFLRGISEKIMLC